MEKWPKEENLTIKDPKSVQQTILEGDHERKNSMIESNDGYLNIADYKTFQRELLKDCDNMETDEDMPQTDEVKFILYKLADLKQEKHQCCERIISIDKEIEELQTLLIKEKDRTSVSDNIKIFEGLKGPTLRRPERAYSSMYEKPKTEDVSSYVDLWFLSDKDAVVEVPESFVKPVKESESESMLVKSTNEYDLPPPVEELMSCPEPPIEIPPAVPQKLNATYPPAVSENKPEHDLVMPVEEPIYMNYETIDDYITRHQEQTVVSDIVSDVSEESEHEQTDEPEEKKPANAELVDHLTVRNLEEADMFAQRQVIIQTFYEQECRYHRYLITLGNLYDMFDKLSRTALHKTTPPLSTADCRTIFFNVPDLIREQKQLVDYISKRLKFWKPDSTFHEIIWKITSNLRMYEEYVNNYKKATQLLCDIVARSSKMKNKPSFDFKSIVDHCKVIDSTEEMPLTSLMYQPIQRLTQHTAIIQDILVYTPSRHSDQTELRKYIDKFWMVLSKINKDHKVKGHRKVEEKLIIKGGYITECIGNERKLRRVILTNGLMICLNSNKTKKWRLLLNKIQIDSIEGINDIDIKLKNRMNTIDDSIMTLHQRMSQNPKKVKILKSEIEKLTLERLKLSQTVPLIIRDMSSNVVRHFMLSSEYERAVWTEAIIKAQMSSFGRISEYEINELIDGLKNHTIESVEFAAVPTKEELISGYLSISVDRAHGFHKNCNVWVAIETDFYSQFTTQARTRIAKTKKLSAVWNEDFELDLDGCSELVALILNNTDSNTDILVAKGALKLNNIKGLVDGQKTRCNINMTGHFKLEVTLKFTKRRHEINNLRKDFGVSLASICAREGDSCPYVIRACTNEVEKRGLNDVGLYRVSAAKSDIFHLKEYFDSNHPDLMRKIAHADVHAVTGVLKKFLMDLPEPLIPEPFSSNLAKIKFNEVRGEDREMAIIQSLINLPKPNQGSLHTLYHHFRTVASVPHNKMNIPNLATVFGPTLLSSPYITSINTVQQHGEILNAILEMENFPSYEEYRLDQSLPQNFPVQSRSATTTNSTFPKAPYRPTPAPRSNTHFQHGKSHQF